MIGRWESSPLPSTSYFQVQLRHPRLCPWSPSSFQGGPVLSKKLERLLPIKLARRGRRRKVTTHTSSRGGDTLRRIRTKKKNLKLDRTRRVSNFVVKLALDRQPFISRSRRDRSDTNVHEEKKTVCTMWMQPGPCPGTVHMQ